jgi:hypothetical protein
MNQEIRVEMLRGEQLDLEEYCSWLADQTQALIYAAPMFHDFLEEAVGGERRYLIARRGEEIAGALTFMRFHDEVAGTVFNSLPWFGSHGACVGVQEGDSVAREALLEAWREAINEPTLMSATLVLTPSENMRAGEYRQILPGCIEDERIGQWTDLPGKDNDDALFSVLKQKTRNLVRKSLKQGFEEVVSDEIRSWKFLHEIHEENMAALNGVGKPWAHFQALRERIPVENRRLSIALLNGKPVAALLLLAFNRTVEYITPVVKVENRSQQPLSFLIWQGMRWAVNKHYSAWNWGGTWSSQTSLLHFKAGWGAVSKPYSYFITSSPRCLSALKSNRKAWVSSFPYYYIYPFDQL